MVISTQVLRGAFPGASAYCGAAGPSTPECAVVEAALCRRASRVFRFGSGTFSAFLVGDRGGPPSAQFLSCPAIGAAAREETRFN